MSHGQPLRPQSDNEHLSPLSQLQQPIKYGDVFNVSGDLASKPISPQDAAAMQAAEIQVLGKTHKGTPADTMQSAAVINEIAGYVEHRDLTDIAKNQGVSVTETKASGQRIITEAVGGQVLGQQVEQDGPTVASTIGSAAIDGDPITIGEALEAVAISAGDKPVDQSDAAAITAAEIRATGSNQVAPGGVADTAQNAASMNTHARSRADMTKLSDVLMDATEKLATDKAVTKEDAEAVFAAEVQFPWRRDSPDMLATPGGVASSMATAAQLNEQ
ncbi:late embryogenesis abundant protein D-34-like [Prosopis cineraria]|uniref:late embryogenesis abundant protein D-34-like n=1 Tax=Prosopis cineraria TaxID=364024 RepID=UPI00241067CD|nr:late embryogenesis abundant protein D-34-like [Prosopis cineraria]